MRSMTEGASSFPQIYAPLRCLRQHLPRFTGEDQAKHNNEAVLADE